MIIQQISVFLENRAGRLTEVTQALSEARINISAQCIAEASEYGVLRMVVSDPLRAQATLREHGFSVSLTDVVCLSVENAPGALHQVLELLSTEGQSLEYMYAFAVGPRAWVVLRTRDVKETLRVLVEHQHQLVGVDEISAHPSSS
jgi:hypothetical protein